MNPIVAFLYKKSFFLTNADYNIYHNEISKLIISTNYYLKGIFDTKNVHIALVKQVMVNVDGFYCSRAFLLVSEYLINFGILIKLKKSSSKYLSQLTNQVDPRMQVLRNKVTLQCLSVHSNKLG